MARDTLFPFGNSKDQTLVAMVTPSFIVYRLGDCTNGAPLLVEDGVVRQRKGNGG